MPKRDCASGSTVQSRSKWNDFAAMVDKCERIIQKPKAGNASRTKQRYQKRTKDEGYGVVGHRY